jgi:hypothetical protein
MEAGPMRRRWDLSGDESLRTVALTLTMTAYAALLLVGLILAGVLK